MARDDRANLVAVLQQKGAAAPMAPDGMGMDPATLYAAFKTGMQILATVAPFLGGPNAKKTWAENDKVTDKLAATYGTNFIAGSQVAGLDPNAVASAMSDYLKERGVNLTPQQLLAMHPAGGAGGLNIMALAPFLMLAAGAFIMLRK